MKGIELQFRELELTDDQRANFERLAELLDAGTEYPVDFNMKSVFNAIEAPGVTLADDWYTSMLAWEAAERPDCGAVGCALGWAAAHRIGLGGGERLTPDYGQSELACDITSVWEWVFSLNWHRIDNTPEGCAARIRYMLATGGVPHFYQIGTKGQTVLLHDWIKSDYERYIEPYRA